MPPNTVYVGRPTEWGNPYGTPDDPFHDTAEAAVEAYCWYLNHLPDGEKARKRVGGSCEGRFWRAGARWIGGARLISSWKRATPKDQALAPP